MRFPLLVKLAGVVVAMVAPATQALARDWNISIGYNDQIGARYNAHTVSKHERARLRWIGTRDAYLGGNSHVFIRAGLTLLV